MITIESAAAGDLPDVLALLSNHSLPLDGVSDSVRTMVVARHAGGVVGVAALEIYDGSALLRSVAVDPAAQGKRIGHMLTEAILDLARDRGIGDVYLLTTTAEAFFPRFGFERIARADVPDSVQTSVEFQSACPASAVVMRKRISST